MAITSDQKKALREKYRSDWKTDIRFAEVVKDITPLLAEVPDAKFLAEKYTNDGRDFSMEFFIASDDVNALLDQIVPEDPAPAKPEEVTPPTPTV